MPDWTDALSTVILYTLIETLVPDVQRHVIGRRFLEARARVTVPRKVVEEARKLG